MRIPIRRTALLASVVFGACSSSTESPQADLVVLGATVIDGTGAAPRPETDIFVYEGEITAVLPGGSAAVPDGATKRQALQVPSSPWRD